MAANRLRTIRANKVEIFESLERKIERLEKKLPEEDEEEDEEETSKELITEIKKNIAEGKEWTKKGNNKAIKSIKERRKANMMETQNELIIKNVSKPGPMENNNKMRDSIVKHINKEAKKQNIEPIKPNQIAITKITWKEKTEEGENKQVYGAHKVKISGGKEYRKLMFTNLKNTNMRQDLGDRISVKNSVPKHLLARSKHLERVGEKMRKEKKVQTKTTLREGGLYLHYREKNQKNWIEVDEEDLTIEEEEKARRGRNRREGEKLKQSNEETLE